MYIENKKKSKIKILEKNVATNDTKKLVIYNKKWEKNTQSNKDISIILENQRMKIFLEHLCFHIGEGVVSEKLIFTVKKNLLFFVYLFFLFLFFF